MGSFTFVIVSDIHYAGAAEQERRNFVVEAIDNPMLRLLARAYLRHYWMGEPFNNNQVLDQFLKETPSPDWLIANGDYSCDSGFVGLSDDAAFGSARECLGKLRTRFGRRMQAIYGDHELGKLNLFGGHGGMRLGGWHRMQNDLRLDPFWTLEAGDYLLIGVVSSVIALPVFEPETLPAERREWEELRNEHLARIRCVFQKLARGQKVILFCHDPTALPFLARDPVIGASLERIEQTVIGHLHSPLVFWKSRMLAGLPAIGFMGNTVRRHSSALREARHWRPFNVRLCPAISGIELLKDGGFLTMELDSGAKRPARFELHPLGAARR